MGEAAEHAVMTFADEDDVDHEEPVWNRRFNCPHCGRGTNFLLCDNCGRYFCTEHAEWDSAEYPRWSEDSRRVPDMLSLLLLGPHRWATTVVF